MRFSFLFSIPFIVLAWAGCQPYSEDDKEEKTSQEIIQDTTSMACTSVRQAQNLYRQSCDTTVCLKGYVVGCVEGTALSKSNFEPPFLQESNILLADDKEETDVRNCLPVRLYNSSVYREKLNLVSHPENKGKLLMIQGKLEKYFSTCGIKTIKAYQFLKEDDPIKTDTIGEYIITPIQ